MNFELLIMKFYLDSHNSKFIIHNSKLASLTLISFAVKIHNL